MFGLRWHDLFGMCVRRRAVPAEAVERGAVAPTASREFHWWRVRRYYNLERDFC